MFNPDVSLQFIRACEALVTGGPVTDKRPLASVLTDMRSEEEWCPERLLTAGDVADVLPLQESRLTGPAQKVHFRVTLPMVFLTFSFSRENVTIR